MNAYSKTCQSKNDTQFVFRNNCIAFYYCIFLLFKLICIFYVVCFYFKYSLANMSIW